MFDSVTGWLEQFIFEFTELWPEGSFFYYQHNVQGLLAVLLVCLVCGAVGALIVGNRMAFFSDALAHCAFAGVALGLAFFVLVGSGEEVYRQQIVLVMVAFGIIIGLLIAYVRESTDLASDTVIGVFYAGSIGLGAVFLKLLSGRRIFTIESFIFGDPTLVSPLEIIWLLLLSVGTAVFLCCIYNPLVLSSANTSLAQSRRMPVRLYRYLFIVLLGLIVNLSLFIVGTLLINGLLIVPAAAAANFSRNLRQMFWFSVGITLAVGLGGYLLSWELGNRFPDQLGGVSGTIVVLAVVIFIISAVLGAWLRQRSWNRPVQAVKTVK